MLCLCLRKAKIDHCGRAWLTALISDDIKVVLRLNFRNEGLGVAIYTKDFDILARLWFNGETFILLLLGFYVARATLLRNTPDLRRGIFLW